MAVAITSKAVTLPILKIVQGGKLTGTILGETIRTHQGNYRLIEIGCPTLHAGSEVGVTLKWVRLSHKGGHNDR